LETPTETWAPDEVDLIATLAQLGHQRGDMAPSRASAAALLLIVKTVAFGLS
jgi:hypothetical protein